VYLTGNPLSAKAQEDQIRELKGLGVSVTFEKKPAKAETEEIENRP